MITAYHDPGFAAPIGDHVMPMRKFQLIADKLAGRAGVHVEAPAPVAKVDLLRVHTAAYVDAVQSGEPRALAESQKFPWSPVLFPSVLLTNGGVLAAATRALDDGIAAALASGFHHSHADHGEGFCTFNGLVVAADALLRATGRVDRVAVLDLDLHYGNGTASLCAARPWLTNCSIYGNDYWENKPYKDVENRRHTDGANHVSFALPNGSGRAVLMETLDRGIAALMALGRPDLVLYQAGADPYREDPYSPLDLDHDDLRERDRAVFEWTRREALPVAWVLAGGYTPDVSKVVDVHVGTFDAAQSVYRWSPRRRAAAMKLVTRLLGVWTGFVLLFFYLPIAVLVLFSFNQSRLNIVWTGFTLDWYTSLWSDTVLVRALQNSLIVAVFTTAISLVLGTAGAWLLYRYRYRAAALLETISFLPMIVPEVILGVSLLILFVTIGMQLGYTTIIISHVTFCFPFVMASVRARLAGLDPSLEEAALDLGATPLQAFAKVLVPYLMPAIVSGGLMSFTLSLDELIVTYFTASAGTRTLPLEIFGRVKKGLDPSLNAISTVFIAVTVMALLITEVVRRRNP